MSNRTPNIIPPETASIISAYMSQAEYPTSEARVPENGTHTSLPLIDRESTGSPVSELRISTQSFDHDSVRSPVSRSESVRSVRYEQVPQQEQAEPRSEASTIINSLPASNNHVPEKPEPETLRRSPYQWWLLTPMDVLLALTPLFFLSNSIAGQDSTHN